MASGGSVQEGVTYPRPVDATGYVGLPAGWRAVEYAYKSGKYAELGRTYIRFHSAAKNDALCTIKQAIEKDARNRGLSDKKLAELVAAYEMETAARKQEERERQAKEREEAGHISKEKREESIAFFRNKYGPLDGATVANFEGWTHEHVYRESCGQTAVIYYTPEKVEFFLLKDIEAMFGQRMIQGQTIPDIEEARSRRQTDEKGRVIVGASKNTVHTRTAEDAANKTAFVGMYGERERGHKKRRTIQTQWSATEDSYMQDNSLVIIPIPFESTGFANGAAEVFGRAGVPLATVKEWQYSIAEVFRLLKLRHFLESTLVLALHGCEPGHRYANVLQGLFYERPERMNGHVCFQQIVGTRNEALTCSGLYIFWSLRRNCWKIGRLNDDLAPFAFATGEGELQTQPLRGWMVLTAGPPCE